MRICFYTFQSPATMYVANRLIDSGKLSAVIVQTTLSPLKKVRVLAGRIRRYGIIRVADEISFNVYYALFLKKADERLRAMSLPTEVSHPAPRTNAGVPIYEVDSINSGQGKALLRRLRPHLVIMQSRELIAKDVLAIPQLGFVGCHPGIIPEYRGVYASFWAMGRGELEKVGLSLYVADEGVDTGGIIAQRGSWPKFPLRHFKVESERLIVESVKDFLALLERVDQSPLRAYHKPEAPSRVFSHIGLSTYLKAEWQRGWT